MSVEEKLQRDGDPAQKAEVGDIRTNTYTK
jgi:hypothetical protein